MTKRLPSQRGGRQRAQAVGIRTPYDRGISPRPYAQLHLAVFLFGGAAVFGKLVEISAGALVLARSGIAALFITVVLLAGKQSIAVRNRLDAMVMAGLGLTLAVHWLLFFRSVQVSTASIAVVCVSTFPIFTALLEPCLARRLPAARDLGLAALAAIGVAVIVGVGFDADAASGDAAAGVAWGSASAALFAVLTVINSRMVVGYTSAVIAWFQYLIAALLLIAFYLRDLAEASVRDWLLLVVLGVLITAIAHTLFISSMQTIRSETASLMVSLEPMYGVLLAWLILSERPGPRIWIGGAIILIAVVIGSRRGTGDPVPAADLSRG